MADKAGNIGIMMQRKGDVRKDMKRVRMFLGIAIILICLSSCGKDQTVAVSKYPPEYDVERTWALKDLPDLDGIFKMREYNDET